MGAAFCQGSGRGAPLTAHGQAARSHCQEGVMVLSRRTGILLNLFLLYISWGSTYICLKFCMHAAGPFTVCGARMLAGGLLLSLLLLLRGRWQRPTWHDMGHAAWLALFMVLMASGLLAKGQESIPSSMAAIVSASTPITMLVAGWLLAGEPRPTRRQCCGLLGGGTGLLLLTLGRQDAQGALDAAAGQFSLVGMLWVLAGTLGWVTGTLISRRVRYRSALGGTQSCALLLMLGGLESLLAAALSGEGASLHLQDIGWQVSLAFAWMVVGGSIIAYYSYFWLLAHASIATAVSYEYVIPVIGVLLGWWLGGESLNLRIILSCVLIVGSVFFVIQGRHST